MKSIIITGATSGIGFECALNIARMAPQEQVVVTSRTKKSGEELIQVLKQKTGHEHLLCLPLDLDSLDSVKEFVELFSKQTHTTISALINNAGIQNITKTRYTKDGFESTFGINHLAPFYLTTLLLPFMDQNASITFTASGVHDPKQKTGIEAPVFKPAKELAYPLQTNEKLNVTGQRRYSTSKLYNILTAYQLQKKLSNTSLRVNAFDPGMVPGTGLARTYSPFLRFVWNRIFPLLRLVVPNVNTAKNSGKRLAMIAYSKDYQNFKGKYFEGLKEIKSSTDSYNEDFQNTAWKSTLELLGLNEKEILLS